MVSASIAPLQFATAVSTEKQLLSIILLKVLNPALTASQVLPRCRHSANLRCAVGGWRLRARSWRRRGLHCRSHGRKTCKFAQTFRRVTAPLAPSPSYAPARTVLFLLLSSQPLLFFYKFPRYNALVCFNFYKINS